MTNGENSTESNLLFSRKLENKIKQDNNKPSHLDMRKKRKAYDTSNFLTCLLEAIIVSSLITHFKNYTQPHMTHREDINIMSIELDCIIKLKRIVWWSQFY